jgi:hypothetical protein
MMLEGKDALCGVTASKCFLTSDVPQGHFYTELELIGTDY